jgi:hypothetical protein
MAEHQWFNPLFAKSRAAQLVLFLSLSCVREPPPVSLVAGKDVAPDFELICYCETVGDSPHSIVRLDNNRDLLFALREGQTTEQLRKEGWTFSDSQIRLLVDWQLADRTSSGVVTTRMPLISGETAQRLRRLSASLGNEIGAAIKGDVAEIAAALQSLGRQGSSFSIVFSYILDGLVWEECERRGLLLPHKLSADTPLWTGVFWGIHPRRPLSCGTNSIDKDNTTLKINWSRAAKQKMGPVMSDWESLQMLTDEIAKGRRVKKRELVELFSPYGIVDANGALKIPVLDETLDDPLSDKAKRLAERIAELIVSGLKLDEVSTLLGLNKREDALVIAYHEVMWDLLESMERDGTLARPTLFKSPEDTKTQDVADVMFVVVREPAATSTTP